MPLIACSSDAWKGSLLRRQARLSFCLLLSVPTIVGSARKKRSDENQTADHHSPSKQAGGLLRHSLGQTEVSYLPKTSVASVPPS